MFLDLIIHLCSLAREIKSRCFIPVKQRCAKDKKGSVETGDPLNTDMTIGTESGGVSLSLKTFLENREALIMNIIKLSQCNKELLWWSVSHINALSSHSFSSLTSPHLSIHTLVVRV